MVVDAYGLRGRLYDISQVVEVSEVTRALVGRPAQQQVLLVWMYDEDLVEVVCEVLALADWLGCVRSSRGKYLQLIESYTGP
jgi:hypothetical protein